MNKTLLRMLVGWMVLALPVSAHALSLTEISPADYCAGYDCFGDEAFTGFDFEEFNSDPSIGDGVVASAWAEGNDLSTDGTYLYAYRVLVYDGSSDLVHGISVEFPGLVNDEVFYVDFADGSIAPTVALPTAGGFSVFFTNPGLGPGDLSMIFGAVSSLPYTTSVANMIDDGSEGHFPEVFSPGGTASVPEPGTAMLLGTGLLGLALVGLRRERRGS